MFFYLWILFSYLGLRWNPLSFFSQFKLMENCSRAFMLQFSRKSKVFMQKKRCICPWCLTTNSDCFFLHFQGWSTEFPLYNRNLGDMLQMWTRTAVAIWFFVSMKRMERKRSFTINMTFQLKCFSLLTKNHSKEFLVAPCTCYDNYIIVI
jgi:hypothetical protein